MSAPAPNNEPLAITTLELINQGKVRQLYACPGDRLLIVASDRVSAFDVVFAQAVPRKGEILTQVSNFWFERTAGIVKNHWLPGQEGLLKDVLGAQDYQRLAGCSMLVRRAQPLPIEAIVRQYLEGSAWQEYQDRQTVGQQPCPADLSRYDRLPQPIFTPTTKAEVGGKDVAISAAAATDIIGTERFDAVRAASLRLFAEASRLAHEKGLVLCDTKFEFGVDADGELILIDEALTPDSSRYWLMEDYQKGQPRPMDKQYLRDWLVSQGFRGHSPIPTLPDEITSGLSERYASLACRLMMPDGA